MACPHLGPQGCSVYGDRPRICQEFCCAWLQNSQWHSRWRPDRLGLMCLREKLDGDLFASAVYEIRPGILESRAAKPVLAALRDSSAAVVLINVQHRRRCLIGNSSADAAHPTPPAPHFRIVPRPETSPPRVFPIRDSLRR